MLHTQIENGEVIERYVRNRLAPEERRALEEHFFACDECFAKVQEMERFVAGVRDAAERGILARPEEKAAGSLAASWLPWAFSISTCATVALAISLGWITLRTLPQIQRDLTSTAAEVQAQQQVIARLRETRSPLDTPEANVPLVMLQASRGEETSQVIVPADAKRLVIWVELAPTRFTKYRMEIFSESGDPVASIENLLRGPYGAIAASLPADQLHPGMFRITLAGQAPPPASLVGEYRIRIRRP
jgi:hypothetical protein